jgi:hypothetical protein
MKLAVKLSLVLIFAAGLYGLHAAVLASDLPGYPPSIYFLDRDEPRGDNWIRLTGTVERFFGDTITLNTGSETVDVNIDDLDIDDMDDIIQEGDQLLVIGELDDGGLDAEIDAWRIHASTDYGTVVLGR